MRIIKEAAERRNEILDTAEKLFYQKGYAKTTIMDILSAIGIAKGTFYYYFKSKEEVLDAIIQRIVLQDAAAAKAIAADPAIPTGDKLFQVLLVQRPKNSDSKTQILQQFQEPDNAEMRQKALIQSVLHMGPILAGIIEQGIREQLFHTNYPKEAIEVLLISSTYLFDGQLFHLTGEEVAHKAEAFIAIMEAALGAPKGHFQNIQQLILENNSP